MQTPALCPLRAGGGLTCEVFLHFAPDPAIEIVLDFVKENRCQGAGFHTLIRWTHADQAPSFFPANNGYSNLFCPRNQGFSFASQRPCLAGRRFQALTPASFSLCRAGR